MRRISVCLAIGLMICFGTARGVGAATVVNGTIMVGPSDVLVNQDPTGFDFRYSYGTSGDGSTITPDAYHQNGNWTTDDVVGWQNAVYSNYLGAYFDVGGTKNLGRDGTDVPEHAGLPAVFVWKFDFTGTYRKIDQLQVRATSWHQVASRSTLEVSTDGTSWINYAYNISTEFATYESYSDLTSVAQGSQVYYIRATVFPNYFTDTRLFCAAPGFGEREYAAFDNQVWLSDAKGTLTGHVILKDFVGSTALTPVQISLVPQGSGTARTEKVYLDPSGNYSISLVDPGTYNVVFTACKFLLATVSGKVVSPETSATCDAELLNGDVDGDGLITSTDVSTVLKSL